LTLPPVGGSFGEPFDQLFEVWDSAGALPTGPHRALAADAWREFYLDAAKAGKIYWVSKVLAAQCFGHLLHVEDELVMV